MLYIVRFLHQTTTIAADGNAELEVVYRPFPTSNHNHIAASYFNSPVVYRPFPTSNHNWSRKLRKSSKVVYRPFPTSNHNCRGLYGVTINVVYRPFPTSNHNLFACGVDVAELYIVRFLHQTTTGLLV